MKGVQLLIKILAITAYLANLLLPDSLAYWLSSLVSTKDMMPADDGKRTLIIPVAHGATQDRLTKGAEATATTVRQLLNYYTNSVVAFGSFTGGNEEFERRRKYNIFGSGDIRYYGGATSTIDEPLGALMVTEGEKFERVILVTDEAHSLRGGRVIFPTFFPGIPVIVCVVPLRAAVDPESPMETYHNPWKALIFQVLPTPIYWWWARKGAGCLTSKAGFHQPIAK